MAKSKLTVSNDPGPWHLIIVNGNCNVCIRLPKTNSFVDYIFMDFPCQKFFNICNALLSAGKDHDRKANDYGRLRIPLETGARTVSD